VSEAEEEDKDEENDPHDDAEIIDCEDEPNAGNDGGEGRHPIPQESLMMIFETWETSYC
jgi:hypothetical protein